MLLVYLLIFIRYYQLLVHPGPGIGGVGISMMRISFRNSFVHVGTAHGWPGLFIRLSTCLLLQPVCSLGDRRDCAR